MGAFVVDVAMSFVATSTMDLSKHKRDGSVESVSDFGVNGEDSLFATQRVDMLRLERHGKGIGSEDLGEYSRV